MWNSDLDTYTKAFHKLAVEVSAADRQILENGHNASLLLTEDIQIVQGNCSRANAG